MDLNNMPNKILERICMYLTFAEVSKLRGLSQNIHFIARQILNGAFVDLGPRLATQYTSHLIHTRNHSSKNLSSDDSAFRGRLLKLLSSEHSILLAFCRHYIIRGARCFAAGEILDLFHKLMRNESSHESPDEENNNVAKLILLIDQYLDWFEKHRMTSEKCCPWFGACIIDLLDSYQSSKYNLSASQNGSFLKLVGQYTINGYVEAPPEIGDPLGCQISEYELLQVLRYLRKHARWHNFVMTFQDPCDQDLEKEQVKIHTKRTPTGYDIFYKKKNSGTLDNRDNVVSIRAIISLQCHRSLAPARLCSRHDLRNFVTKDDMKLNGNSSKETLSEDSKNLHKIVENSCTPLRLMSNGMISSSEQRKNDEEMYNFGLELRLIYPKKWSGSNHGIGEKFGETTLNINHTFENIFAAKSEFRLF